MEAGFLAQRKTPLLRSCKSLLPIPLTFYSLGVIMNFLMSKHLRSSFPTDAAHQSQQVEIVCDILMFVLTACFLALLQYERFVERMGTFTLELAIATLLTLMMLTLTLSEPQTISRLLGQDMAETYGADWYGSDSSLVLKIDIIVTGAHLGPKVRWLLLLPMSALAVLLYATIAFVVGSAEPMGGTAYNMLLLTGLILTASVAKRVSERGERQAFLDIIEEKSLRCEAEFQLSQSKSEGSREGLPQPPRSVAESSSVPTTALSGQVFDPMNEDDVDATAQLARIAEIGEAEHWLVDGKQINYLEGDVLGAGSFGVVARAIFCGLFVAVKCPPRCLDTESLKRLPSFCNELRVLRHLKHPNIVATFGAVVDPQAQKIAIVLELVQGATLDHFVMAAEAQGGDGPGPLARYQVMLGICRALVYMHTRRPHLVHGDLKSANVMVDFRDAAAHPKLLDFGLSRLVTQNSRPLGGTMVWMAPEAIRKIGPVRCSADVYSFGRMVAFVSTGIPPLSGLNARQMKAALMSDTPPQPAWPQGCVFKPHLKAVVRGCIRADPARRPGIEEVHEQLLGLTQDLDLGGPGGCAFLTAVETIRTHLGPARRRRTEEQREVPAVSAIVEGLTLEQVAVLPKTPSQAPDGSSLRDELNPVPEGGILEAGAAAPEGEEPLEAGAESRTAESRTTGQSSMPLLHPGKLPTEPGVMAVSLLELITRWNFQVAEVPCCQFHAGTRMAQQLIGALLARPCFRQTQIAVGGQCLSCGILGLEENVPVCQLCRSASAPNASPPSAGPPSAGPPSANGASGTRLHL